MDNNKIKRGFVSFLKYYVVDTTALLTTSTPIYAAMETFASGMSSDTSLEARIKIAGISYMGLAVLYTKARDLSKYIFKVTDSSSRKINIIHDSIYASVFNIIASIPIYMSSGADLEQTLKGTAGAVFLSLTTGAINGFGVDAYRDFTGVKESRRLPKKIKELSPNAKKWIAAGLIAASVGLTALVYKANNEYSDYINNKKYDLPKAEADNKLSLQYTGAV